MSLEQPQGGPGFYLIVMYFWFLLFGLHSSDRASKEDRGILEDLFVDEIWEFNEEHNLDGWE